MRIRAFKPLRPPVELVARLASPPYDVLDSVEARKMAEGNPASFLHINKPEIDLPESVSVYDDAVYAQGAKNFRMFQEKGYLVRAPSPSVYLYRQRMGTHVQSGLVCLSSLQDYEEDRIKKHEKTKKFAEDDRTRHTSTLSANAGPVFLTYKDNPAIDALLASVPTRAPLYDFTAPDGVVHTVWEISESEPLVKAFASIPASYIADGHHRAASAARVGRERREANPRHNGTEDYNWFLSVLFPASHLQVLAYNRVVADLNGRSMEAFLAEVSTRFRVTKGARPVPTASGHVSMFLGGAWHDLSWANSPSDPVDALDVSVLQDRLLGPVLGIDDPRTNPRIQFVGGIRGSAELEKLVNSGRGAVAFHMFPTTVAQLMAVADAGRCMPPKSTWFEPKLRSGLLVHTF